MAQPQLRQKMRCGRVETARVWHDTTDGWRGANERLALAVDRHLRTCTECQEHYAAQTQPIHTHEENL